MRLTEAEYADLMRRRNTPAAGEKSLPSAEREPAGRRQVATSAENAPSGPKFKSKAEARYAQILEARKRAGEIADWDYEPITLVVGRGGSRVTRFTPDFAVHLHDRTVELVEVKGGYIRDDARVKLLAAVRQWPGFRWTLVVGRKGGFDVERLA